LLLAPVWAQVVGVLTVTVQSSAAASGTVLATIDDREAQVGMQHAQTQIERTRNLQGKGFVSKAALDARYCRRAIPKRPA